MNTDTANDPMTEQIIGCAFKVANALGHGSLEKVYENALSHELRKSGLEVIQQRAIPVMCDGIVVGDYIADIVVDGSIVIELKTVKALDEIHMAQCMNYLKATGIKKCLLLNFGKPRIEIKRILI